MQRRTVFLIAGVVVAAASLGGAFCVWAFVPDSFEEKVQRIQNGMTRNEVITALASPNMTEARADGHETADGWITDRVTIVVHYDDDGKVAWKELHRRPLWDRIRKKLPWHKNPSTGVGGDAGASE